MGSMGAGDKSTQVSTKYGDRGEGSESKENTGNHSRNTGETKGNVEEKSNEHFVCLYTIASSMENKKEEPEILVKKITFMT